MVNYIQFFDSVKEINDYSQKANMLAVLLNAFNDKKFKITAEEKAMISEFLFSEIQKLIVLIPTVESYREKDTIFEYEDNLLGLVMRCHASVADISQTNVLLIETLIAVVDKERFIEDEIDDIFKGGNTDKKHVLKLLNELSVITDEYHRSKLYSGLLHYQNKLTDLPNDSKQLLEDYIHSELKRYLSSEKNEEILNNLEIISDVAKYFISDDIVIQLKEVLKLGVSRINYYALETLLDVGTDVPIETIIALANDLEYADLTYAILNKYGKSSMFPSELATEEYLAKSNLVHWLTYPTELGKQPDQIEYLGKVKKKEFYHIFRYTSDSENLGDELKGKWLIGWSNDDGGTFSNFDRYEDYEQKTLEKTLKLIKKKLL